MTKMLTKVLISGIVVLAVGMLMIASTIYTEQEVDVAEFRTRSLAMTLLGVLLLQIGFGLTQLILWRIYRAKKT